MAGRSTVYARGGMIAASQPLAVSAGLEVLAEGGNAADASVAAMGVLYAIEPMMCGLGGDAFVVYHRASDRSVTAFCGSGAAPAMATREAYAELGHGGSVPGKGMLSVSVPGAVDCTSELLKRCGSGRFGLTRLWRRAIALADAHPLPPKLVGYYGDAPAHFRSALPAGGPRPGALVRNGDLAAAMAAVAERGADWFYRGPFAQSLDAHSRAQGGLLRSGDMAAHRTWVGPPLSVEALGLRFFVPALPSQGLILLEELGMLAADRVDALAPAGAHLLVEARKRAFADRQAYAGDPDFVQVPIGGLLSPEYLRARRAGIDAARAAIGPADAGDPWPLESAHGRRGVPRADGSTGDDTTYFAVVDADGNGASVIISVAALWGSGEVVPGTGVVLNDRASGFSMREDHPNRLEPGKRTMHTLHCYLATDSNGRLMLVGGTPGGDNQPQWNLQVLSHLLMGGRDPQDAVEAPRWTCQGVPRPAPGESAYRLQIEEGFPQGFADTMTAMGHRTAVVGPWQGGGAAQIIVRDGVWESSPDSRAASDDAVAFAGGSDPRADGHAAGL